MSTQRAGLGDAMWRAKTIGEYAAKLNEALANVEQDIAKASDDARAAIDWSKPVPEFTFLPYPALAHPLTKNTTDLAAMTDEQCDAVQALIDQHAAENRKIGEHNAAVTRRWSAFLEAHGVGTVKRTDVRALAIACAEQKGGAHWRRDSGSSVINSIAWQIGQRNAHSVRELRGVARMVKSAQDNERRAEREREEEQMNIERENERLRAELARRAQPAPAPARMVPSATEKTTEDGARIRALELE